MDTTLRISKTAHVALKKLAKKQLRSLKDTLELLIQEAAAKQGASK